MERCGWCMDGGPMQQYHDEEWGVPLHDDQKQFEFLFLEAMQCGLSWGLMIKKREIFRQCFDGFDFHKIARYGEADIERILQTEGMIRSRAKIGAIINNARRFLEIIEEFGSFDKYLWGFTDHHTLIFRKHQQGQPEARNELSDRISKDLKQRGFKYLGSITVFSHLQACGIINDHDPHCFRYKELLQSANVRYIDD